MKMHINIITTFAIVASLLAGGIAKAQAIVISDKEEMIMKETIEEHDYDEEPVAFETSRTRVILKDELPNEIKSYLGNHFSDYNIIRVYEEETIDGAFHKVLLSKDVKLNFDEKNDLVEIESLKEIPENIIPPIIDLYIIENYPNDSILEWKVKNGGQSVKLDSKKQLLLNKNGEFVRINEK